LFRKVLLRPFRNLAGRTETKIDDYVLDSLEDFGLPILNLIIIYFGINYLTLTEKAEKYIHGAFVVVITYYAVRLVSSTVLLVLQSYVGNTDDGEEKVKQLGGIMLLHQRFHLGHRGAFNILKSRLRCHYRNCGTWHRWYRHCTRRSKYT
jgi:hypothetical protein